VRLFTRFNLKKIKSLNSLAYSRESYIEKGVCVAYSFEVAVVNEFHLQKNVKEELRFRDPHDGLSAILLAVEVFVDGRACWHVCWLDGKSESRVQVRQVKLEHEQHIAKTE